MLARERYSWVLLTGLVLFFGAYFVVVSVLQHAHVEPTFLQKIGILAIAAGSLAIVVLIDRFVAWVRPDRNAKPDERDKLIELRAAGIAYYVLIAGALYVGCYLPFLATTWQIVNSTLAVVVIAEVVHHGLVVLGYRRGWRV